MGGDSKRVPVSALHQGLVCEHSPSAVGMQWGHSGGHGAERGWQLTVLHTPEPGGCPESSLWILVFNK